LGPRGIRLNQPPDRNPEALNGLGPERWSWENNSLKSLGKEYKTNEFLMLQFLVFRIRRISQGRCKKILYLLITILRIEVNAVPVLAGF
jgi:hypothetical protein